MIKNIVSTIKETFNLKDHHKVSSLENCCHSKNKECLCDHYKAGHNQNHKGCCQEEGGDKNEN